MTTQHPLASMKEALQQPFAPETIQFLPKDIRQENGKYTCRALPYANKRIYEDRLNELVFGEWSTPYVPPFAQGNKLILPVTVVILGVAHTDYGEEYFLTTGKNGNTREDENTATEAYSQAFRRACAQFLLGRYLYDLPKLKLPYDPKEKQIAITPAERIAYVEKLYLQRGLIPSRSVSVPQRSVASTMPPKQSISVQQSTASHPSISAQSLASTTTKTEPMQKEPSVPPAPPQKVPAHLMATASGSQQKASPVIKESPLVMQPTTYQDTFLDWVAAKVERDPKRIQGICDYYKITELARLTTRQRNELTQRLRQQTKQQRQPLVSPASASV